MLKTNMLRQNGNNTHAHTNTTHTALLLRLVNKHSAIKAGLLLIRMLCIRQEMLGKLHIIALEQADHHHGNKPTSVP